MDDEAIKREKSKGHRAMRVEIRNAVKEAMLRDGITRERFSKEISNVSAQEVMKRVGLVDIEIIVRKMVREEIQAVLTKNLMGDLRNLVIKEGQKQAAEFVQNNIKISIKDGGEWS